MPFITENNFNILAAAFAKLNKLEILILSLKFNIVLYFRVIIN